MYSIVRTSCRAGALLVILASSGVAAESRTLTAADYAQAERFMSYRTVSLVDHSVENIHWLDDGYFWYRDHDATGDHFMQMDADTGKASPLFDQARLAAALGKASGKAVDAAKLPIDGYSVAPDGRSVQRRAAQRRLESAVRVARSLPRAGASRADHGSHQRPHPRRRTHTHPRTAQPDRCPCHRGARWERPRRDAEKYRAA